MIRTHRLRGLRRGALVLTLLCSALALMPGPAQARHPGLELDDLDDDTLGAMLDDELGDDDLVACGIGDPHAAVGDAKLLKVIMCALGEGHAGDGRALDLDDLEDEMREAGTTVRNVVWASILEADRLASGERLFPAGRVAVVYRGAGADAAGKRSGDPQFAVADNFVDPGDFAVGPVKQGLIRGVRAVNKKKP